MGAKLPPQREADFQKVVIQYAQMQGWRVAHFKAVTVIGDRGRTRTITPVAADGKGYPDLTMTRERVVFAELKAERGSVRADQHVWFEALEAAGAEIYVWKPRDWPQILEVLR